MGTVSNFFLIPLGPVLDFRPISYKSRVVILTERHLKDGAIIGWRCAIEVLKCAIPNL